MDANRRYSEYFHDSRFAHDNLNSSCLDSSSESTDAPRIQAASLADDDFVDANANANANDVYSASDDCSCCGFYCDNDVDLGINLILFENSVLKIWDFVVGKSQTNIFFLNCCGAYWIFMNLMCIVASIEYKLFQ